jgi:hypothetical protein
MMLMLLKDSKEMDAVDGAVRTVYPARYHDTETFNERMDAAGVAGIPEHEADDSTCEMSITMSSAWRFTSRSASLPPPVQCGVRRKHGSTAPAWDF